jgi:glycerate kinase
VRRSALACPASLKGVLSAVDAAAALAEGFAAAGVECEQCPVADGGEGLLDVLGGERRRARVSDPLGRPVEAQWSLLDDETAVVEAAQAVGLPLLAPGERDPLRASSRGLGELILAALAERPRALLVGLGGSATVDGGAGLREVVSELPVPTAVACDVRTTLADAARLYGPQKGATPEQVRELERRLAGMSELAPYAALPGSGAAGGLGAALAALGAELRPGAQLVLERLDFRARVRRHSLAVTGEGTVDETTFEGKAPGEVLRACAEEGVECVLFGGRVNLPSDNLSLTRLSGDPERAAEDLVELGERLARALLGHA